MEVFLADTSSLLQIGQGRGLRWGIRRGMGSGGGGGGQNQGKQDGWERKRNVRREQDGD